MNLQNFQAEFAEALLNNDSTIDSTHPANHIQIYHNNRMANLIHALEDSYPLILKLVGVDFFGLIAKKYISSYPARSGNLHEYGEYFSDFLAEQPSLKNLIYLAEVAQFEWICHTLSFAVDPNEFNLKKLENLTPDHYDQLYFVLHPASRINKFHYPVLSIIDLCDGKLESLDVSNGGVDLLIIRRKLELCLVPLSVGDFTFLNALQENKSVSEALNITLNIDANFKLDEKLPAWIQDQTIVDCCQHTDN